MNDHDDVLGWAGEEAARFRAGLTERPVQPPIDIEAARAALGTLERAGVTALDAVRQLAGVVSPAATATAGPRYFGFVVGVGARRLFEQFPDTIVERTVRFWQ